MSWFVSDIRTPNSAVSICLYISNIKYMSSDLQLGKLKENFLATQAFANSENISEPQTGIELRVRLWDIYLMHCGSIRKLKLSYPNELCKPRERIFV